MTGDIEKAITLTTFGTLFLKDNYDISGLTLEHPSFAFTNKVEFHFFKKHFFRKPTWHVYASSPINWLTKLKEDGCKELRFVFYPNNHHSLNGEAVPDHKLAGFVGGGGHRFIEAVFPDHSDFWQARAEVTDKDAPDRKIWTITYGRTLIGQPTQQKTTYDIHSVRQRLTSALKDISAFAKRENQLFWSDWFDKALYLLETNTPYEKEQDKLMIPTDKTDLHHIQLLAAAGSAWCFGGMGSWNDVGFNDKNTQATYNTLTAELYDIVNESYLAAANAY